MGGIHELFVLALSLVWFAGVTPDKMKNLGGMFRRSASLAIPHLKSFAAIPSVSLVQLGHTNRNVFLSYESQREIDLVWALSRPIPYYQQGEVGEEKWACVSQCLCF